MILQAQQPERRGLGVAEVAGGEQRNAERNAAQQQQEESGQRIDAHVKRQVGQARRQDRAARRRADRPQSGRGKRERHHGAGGKHDAGNDARRAHERESRHAQPDPDHREGDRRLDRLQR